MIQADVVAQFMEGLLEGSSTEEGGVFGPQPMKRDYGRLPFDVRLAENKVERIHVKIDRRHDQDVLPAGLPGNFQKVGGPELIASGVIRPCGHFLTWEDGYAQPGPSEVYIESAKDLPGHRAQGQNGDMHLIPSRRRGASV